jgi:hypothetical protein
VILHSHAKKSLFHEHASGVTFIPKSDIAVAFRRRCGRLPIRLTKRQTVLDQSFEKKVHNQMRETVGEIHAGVTKLELVKRLP